MATILGSLLLKITGDTADARQAIDKVEKKAKGFSKFIKGALGIGGAIIAFRMLKNVATDLTAAYGVQETAEAKLRSAITATGREGSISAEKLFDYASQLQEVTTYGDEATISAMALLQQLGDLSEEGIKQLTPLIQDFASTGLVNLETAASLVGKTLDSTTNALTRYGIVIDMSGTKEEKLAEITEGLQKKFGGLSKDLATTGTGAMQQLNNIMGDIKEQGGKALLDFLEPAIRGMTDLLSTTLQTWVAKRNLNKALKGEATTLYEVDKALETQNEILDENIKKRDELKPDIAALEAEVKRFEDMGAFRNAEYLEKVKLLKQKKDGLYVTQQEINQAVENVELLKEERTELEKMQTVKTADVIVTKAQTEADEEAAKAAEEALDARIKSINTEVDAAMAAYQLRVDAEQAYQEELAEIRERAREQEKLAAEKLAEDKRRLEQATLDFITQIWGALDSLGSARASRELALLEEQHEAELEGFTGTEEEKQALIEKFEKERAKLEYEAAMKSWNLQIAGGLAAAARAVLEAAKNAWPIPALPMMALAGIMGGIQTAAIYAAKPVPAFAEGANFVVPPGYPNDSYLFRAESGEHVEVTPPGREEGFFVAAPLYLNIDSKPIYQGLLKATKDGIALVNEKAVTTR